MRGTEGRVQGRRSRSVIDLGRGRGTVSQNID
ncbi:MAG: hypothetical protein KDI23_12605 [Pseudomonadales bacterium]|nr:hypothetical protein [Pseudomonadales bacterium]